MNNKGFTLTEYISIFVILALVAVITLPVIRDVLNESREKAYNIQIENITRATKDWILKGENINNLPTNENDMITLTLGTLKNSGVIELNIKNPNNNELFPNDMLITVTRKMNDYDIKVLDTTGTVGSLEMSADAPSIVLNGPYLVYVELNDEYQELGSVATSNVGNDLTPNIVKEIYVNNSQVANVLTSGFNTYLIYYHITDNDYTSTIIRTVIIRDNTAPVITFNEETTITIDQVATFNPLHAVNVTDNSNTEVDLTYTGTVSEVVGKYLITYKAIDQSGNEITKKRIIKVIE